MTSSDICLRFDKNIASKVREVYNNSMGRRLLWCIEYVYIDTRAKHDNHQQIFKLAHLFRNWEMQRMDHDLQRT